MIYEAKILYNYNTYEDLNKTFRNDKLLKLMSLYTLLGIKIASIADIETIEATELLKLLLLSQDLQCCESHYMLYLLLQLHYKPFPI